MSSRTEKSLLVDDQTPLIAKKPRTTDDKELWGQKAFTG